MLRHGIAVFFFLTVTLSGEFVMAETDQELEARNKALVAAKFQAWASGTDRQPL
jgi:hypothetical protein